MTMIEEMAGLAFIALLTIFCGWASAQLGKIHRAGWARIYRRRHTARRWTGPTYDPQMEP